MYILSRSKCKGKVMTAAPSAAGFWPTIVIGGQRSYWDGGRALSLNSIIAK